MKLKIEATNHTISPHPNMIAWKNSRPLAEGFTYDEIVGIDLPVNEMPMVTLFVTSTIIEREIFASMRNHVMWAQGTRVQDVLEFTYPEQIAASKIGVEFECKREIMKRRKIAGERQDIYRGDVPAFSTTKYTINISMRDLISVGKEFIRLSDISEDKIVRDIFKEADESILDLLFKHFNLNLEKFYNYSSKRILYPLIEGKDGSMGGIVSVSGKLPLSLRAQVVRHRRLQVRDNLEKLITGDDSLKLINDSIVEVQISGFVEDWQDVIRKRSCWLAQYDLWADIINKAEEHLGFGVNSLPCHDGACKYDGDAMLRYTDKDPNAPCPHSTISESTCVSPSV